MSTPPLARTGTRRRPPLRGHVTASDDFPTVLPGPRRPLPSTCPACAGARPGTCRSRRRSRWWRSAPDLSSPRDDLLPQPAFRRHMHLTRRLWSTPTSTWCTSRLHTCAPRRGARCRCGQACAGREALGLDATEAEEVSAAAAAAGVFCMEAMWTFFLPRFDVVRQVLEPGSSAMSARCWPTTASGSTSRTGILDPAMAGGASSTSAPTSRLSPPGPWPGRGGLRDGRDDPERRERTVRHGAETPAWRVQCAPHDPARPHSDIGCHRGHGDSHPAGLLHARRRRPHLCRRTSHADMDGPRAHRPRRALPLCPRGSAVHLRRRARVATASGRGRDHRPSSTRRGWPPAGVTYDAAR